MKTALQRHATPLRRPQRAVACAAALAAAVPATAALAPATAALGSPPAHAARTLNLKETGHLRLHDHHGPLLKEQGIAKGTLSGPLYLQLRLTSQHTATAQAQFYPSSGGLLRGYAQASYHVTGGYVSFSGTMNVTSGSGRYAKARGYGLSFTGTVQRSNGAVTVYLSGRLSY